MIASVDFWCHDGVVRPGYGVSFPWFTFTTQYSSIPNIKASLIKLSHSVAIVDYIYCYAFVQKTVTVCLDSFYIVSSYIKWVRHLRYIHLCYHHFPVLRPILVLKGEQGFVGYKSGTVRLECNKATYETIQVRQNSRNLK